MGKDPIDKGRRGALRDPVHNNTDRQGLADQGLESLRVEEPKILRDQNQATDQSREKPGQGGLVTSGLDDDESSDRAGGWSMPVHRAAGEKRARDPYTSGLELGADPGMKTPRLVILACLAWVVFAVVVRVVIS